MPSLDFSGFARVEPSSGTSVRLATIDCPPRPRRPMRVELRDFCATFHVLILGMVGFLALRYILVLVQYVRQ